MKCQAAFGGLAATTATNATDPGAPAVPAFVHRFVFAEIREAKSCAKHSVMFTYPLVN